MRTLILLLLVPSAVHAQERYPGKDWEVVRSPGDVGWSAKKLAVALEHLKTLNTAALVVVHDGRIVLQWGETKRAFKCHSVRKSILSALYGIQVDNKKIKLDRTMQELGIDDNEPSLTEGEKKATVRMLLKARSGVYHAALYETKSMKKARPKRGSHEPNTFWYYNNWDFNALGTIFENRTGKSLFEAFQDGLARPLGMEDFRRERHTRYVTGPDSVHPAYPFRLSARDLARLGLLFARNGRWKDKQIISSKWVAESTTAYSKAGSRGGYGYLWWVAVDGVHFPGVKLPEGSFSARGVGGQIILVLPKWDLVIVHRVNTFKKGNRVRSSQFGKLLNLILKARIEE